MRPSVIIATLFAVSSAAGWWGTGFFHSEKQVTLQRQPNVERTNSSSSKGDSSAKPAEIECPLPFAPKTFAAWKVAITAATKGESRQLQQQVSGLLSSSSAVDELHWAALLSVWTELHPADVVAFIQGFTETQQQRLAVNVLKSGQLPLSDYATLMALIPENARLDALMGGLQDRRGDSPAKDYETARKMVGELTSANLLQSLEEAALNAAIARSWVSSDALLAWDLATSGSDKKSSDGFLRELRTQAINALIKDNPHIAFDLLSTPSIEQYDLKGSDVASLKAKAVLSEMDIDPDRGVEMISTMLDEGSKEATRAMCLRLNLIPAEELCEMRRKNPELAHRNEVAPAIVRAMLSDDPANVAEFLASFPEAERTGILSKTPVFSDTPAESLYHLLSDGGLKDSLPEGFKASSLRAIAEKDGVAMLPTLLANGNEDLLERSVDILLKHEKGRDGALTAEIEKMQANPLKTTLLAQTYASWASSDMEGAVRALDQSAMESSERQAIGIKMLGANGKPCPEARQLVEQLFSNTTSWETTDFQAIETYLSKEGDKSGESALAWVNQIKKPEGKANGLVSAITGSWAKNDVDGLAAYVVRSPAFDGRDAACASIALQSVDDPQASVRWLEQISDANVRSETTRKLLNGMTPAAAKEMESLITVQTSHP